MAGGERATRVTMTEGGPILVDGPVEIEMPDGSSVRSTRPVVALCACRRSKRHPFCDTSHRRKVRPAAGGGAQPGTSAPRNDDSSDDQAASR